MSDPQSKPVSSGPTDSKHDNLDTKQRYSISDPENLDTVHSYTTLQPGSTESEVNRGTNYLGRVNGIEGYGIFVTLCKHPQEVSGLVHVSEFPSKQSRDHDSERTAVAGNGSMPRPGDTAAGRDSDSDRYSPHDFTRGDRVLVSLLDHTSKGIQLRLVEVVESSGATLEAGTLGPGADPDVREDLAANGKQPQRDKLGSRSTKYQTGRAEREAISAERDRAIDRIDAARQIVTDRIDVIEATAEHADLDPGRAELLATLQVIDQRLAPDRDNDPDSSSEGDQ